MGEMKKQVLRVRFDGQLKFEFHEARISSDTGLLVYPELGETLSLTTDLENVISDSRTGKNI